MTDQALYPSLKGTGTTWRTWPTGALGMALVGMVAGGTVGYVASALIRRATPGSDAKWVDVLINLLIGFGCGIAILLLWVLFFERKSLAHIGLALIDSRKAIRGFGFGILCVSAVVCTLWVSGAAQFERSGFVGAPTIAALIPTTVLLFGFMVQGSAEEISIRGWILPVVASRYGLVAAVVSSSLVFSLAHALNTTMSAGLVLGLVNVFLVGVFLALYAVTEKSIWGPCGWHAAWNWALGQGYGLEVSGQGLGTRPLLVDLTAVEDSPWWYSGAAFGPEASIVTTLLLVAGIGFWLRRLARSRSARPIGPPATVASPPGLAD